MKNLFKLSFISVFLLLLLTSFTTQDPWVHLGSRKVNFGIDKDVINVTYRDGAFTAVKIVVNDGALNMHRCAIFFENGGKQEVALRHNFAKNSDSRVIDLKGNKRFIERIEFWYDTKNAANQRAEVQVWGKK